MKKFFARARAVLEDKGGEGYVDTAVKMIIAVVIGSSLLLFRRSERYPLLLGSPTVQSVGSTTAFRRRLSP